MHAGIWNPTRERWARMCGAQGVHRANPVWGAGLNNACRSKLVEFRLHSSQTSTAVQNQQPFAR